MKVDVIDRFETFNALQANWDAVYAADPEANLFLSWGFMSKWLLQINSRWLILAARRDDKAKDYVAFFPLTVRIKPGKKGGFYTNIRMAGNGFADYAGFICAPHCTKAAIPAFAKTLKTMRWGTIDFDLMRATDTNMNRLLKCFENKRYKTFPKSTVEPDTGIDQAICPYAELPSDWETYLGSLSANCRQKLRRLLRQVDDDPDLTITHVRAETLDRDLESLLDLWGRQWRERKQQRTAVIQQNLRAMLKHCFDLGTLFLPMLWKGDRAVGALGSLIDTQKNTLLFVVGTRDKTFSKPQPGFTLHAHSIRHAISKGIQEYDFLRGDEDYKYSFGARGRRIKSVAIGRRPSAADQTSLLDARSIPEVLTHIRRQHASGELAVAEIGYRQVLMIDAKCSSALWRYGQLKLAQRDVDAAQRLFNALIETDGRSDRAFVGLGHCRAAQRRWADAETYYQRAIELNPKFLPAYYHLGLVQERQGALKNAIGSYQRVIAEKPDFQDARLRLDKAVLQDQDRHGASSHF